MSVILGRFMERGCVLPITLLPIRTCFGFVIHFCMCFTLYVSTLERRHEARIVQIDFSLAFDRVNHQENLFSSINFNLWALDVLCCDTVSLNRSQYVLVDGCQSQLID